MAAPTAPTNFTVTPLEASPGETLHFSWGAATSSDGIQVYQVQGFNPATSSYVNGLPDVGPQTLSATVNFPSDAVSYIEYWVVAVSNSGNVIGASDHVKVYKKQSETPGAPSSISVGDAVQGGSVTVSWSAVSAAGTPAYTLQRSVNGGEFQTVYTGSALTYTDAAGGAWTTVQYRVKASVDGEDSGWTTSSVKNVTPAAASSGARLEQFQNSAREIVYPQTIVEGVFRQSDGKSLGELLAAIENSGPKIELPLSIENGGTSAADAPTALSALIDGGNPTFPSTYYTDMYLPISVDGVCYKVPFTSIQKWTVGDRGSSASQANTSYGSFIARGIAAGTTDYTAGSTSMTNGTIYLVYE